MSRTDDLEQAMAESYDLINQYQAILRESSDPRERARARREIALLRELMKEYRAERVALGDAGPGEAVEPVTPSPQAGAKTDGHIFISYSHDDSGYAHELAAELERRGLVPWIDDRIDYGTAWPDVIEQQIDTCTAFIVVLTPRSKESLWVKNELAYAQGLGKPIFPLLLEGKFWLSVAAIQYLDVRNGRLPPGRFYDRLARAVSPPFPVPETPAVSTLTVEELKPGIALAQPPKWEAPAAPTPVVEEKPGILAPSQPFEPEMILIPAGEFLMGSDPRKDKNAYDAEQPQQRLYLPNYSIAKTPVTNAQFLAFVRTTGRRALEHWKAGAPPGDMADHPVVYVSWRDALAYCRWLAQVTGKPYALPSEAEWEKAARGTDGRIYPWGDDPPDKSRCNLNNDEKGTTPVGRYSPQGDSPYGCADMAGNVWEWTRSQWAGYPYDPADGREELEGTAARVLRGGAFYDDAWSVRCAYRGRSEPVHWYRYFGFRVVLASPG